MTRARMLSSVGLAVALLTGCASTAQVGDDAGTIGDGVGAGAPAVGAGLPSTLPQSPPPGGWSAGTTAGGRNRTAQLPATSGGAAAPAAGPRAGGGRTPSLAGAGPGVTARTITLGVTHVPGADAAFKSLGFSSIAIGDTKAIYEAFIDHVNDTGGVAGRSLRAIYYEYDAGGEREAQHAAACTAMTQDNKVLFATGVTLAFGPSGDTLVPCLARAGTSWITGKWQGDDGHWRRYARHLYSATSASSTREFRALVSAADEQGFFGRTPKLGLVQVERAEMERAVRTGLVPALHERGYRLAEHIRVVSDNSLPAATANAVLRFKAAGITHVLFAAPGGGVPTYFMRSAESQGYQPRYTLGSWDAPSVVQSIAPSSQLRNTVGMGYLPVLDVDARNDPGGNPAAAACEDTFRKRGFSTSNRLAVGQMYQACDTLLLVRRVFSSGVPLNAAGLEHAVERLGDGFRSAGTFATRFRDDAHDGGARYRHLVFVEDCTCFRYRGPLRDFR